MPTEFTCRSGGSNLYAGSLDGTNEASTTPLVTYTNGNWDSTTGIFTPASGDPVAAGVVANQSWVSIYNDGASAPTGFIALVTGVTTTTITVSATKRAGTAPTTSATARTLVVGGAWQGPNGTSGFPFGLTGIASLTNTSNELPRINFKNDQTYSMTAAITHSIAGPTIWQGYTSAFADGGRATLQGPTTGASYIALTLSGGGNTLRDFIVTNNGLTGSSSGISASGARCVLERVVVNNVRGIAFQISQIITLIECEAYAWGASGTLAAYSCTSAGVSVIRCIAHDPSGVTCDGFTTNSVTAFINCIADTVGRHGFNITGGNISNVIGCTAYNCTGSGIINANASAVLYVENCILSNNGAYGINCSVSGGYIRAVNCAFFSNTALQTSGNFVESTGGITLTGIPFVDAPNGDFDLNNTSGAGAACRDAGRGNFTQIAPSYSGTLSYPDVGAVFHQDAGGGGSVAFSGVGRVIG